jgi:hypothetical protein
LEPNSTIKYYSLWWKISRNLKLSGEAEFEVAKGNRFKVSSKEGITEVLGTTFRIEARLSETYKVSCFTGSVKVSDRNSDVSTVLVANEKAEINEPGNFKVTLIQKEIEEKTFKEIEEKTFDETYITFKNQAIQAVFLELENKFGVIIEVSDRLDLYYTGNLKIESNLEELLRAICIPLELEYEQLSNKKYLVRSIGE